MKKFHKHIIPKLPFQYQLLQQGTNSKCSKASSDLINDGNSLDKQNDNFLSSVPAFSTCSIKFNECTLFAISHWAAQSSLSSSFKEKNKKEKKECCPAPDVSLRKCNVCNRWGHYDVECDKMTKSDVLYYSNALRNQSTKPLTKAKHSRVETLTSQPLSDIEGKLQNGTNGIAEVSGETENNSECFICKKHDNSTSRLQCCKCKHQFHIGCVELSCTVFLETGFICSICSEDTDVDSSIESCGRFIFEQSKTLLPKDDSGSNSYINDSQSCAGLEMVQVRSMNILHSLSIA